LYSTDDELRSSKSFCFTLF